MISRLLLMLLLLPLFAGVSLADEDCPEAKNEATARYYRCLAEALAEADADDVAKCQARFEKRLQRADREDGCGFSGGADEIARAVEAFSEAILDAASGKAGVPEVVVNECDLEQVEFLDFEAWQREDGYWVG